MPRRADHEYYTADEAQKILDAMIKNNFKQYLQCVHYGMQSVRDRRGLPRCTPAEAFEMGAEIYCKVTDPRFGPKERRRIPREGVAITTAIAWIADSIEGHNLNDPDLPLDDAIGTNQNAPAGDDDTTSGRSDEEQVSSNLIVSVVSDDDTEKLLIEIENGLEKLGYDSAIRKFAIFVLQRYLERKSFVLDEQNKNEHLKAIMRVTRWKKDRALLLYDALEAAYRILVCHSESEQTAG